MPDFHIEQSLGVSGAVFGLDEAGRGPWCGSVVAACVWWPDFDVPPELAARIDDSKKLSVKRRDELFDLILASNAVVGIGRASAAEIDDLNILNATFLAMKRALDSVVEKGVNPAFVLIDGNRLPKNWDVPAQWVIKGDGLSLSIAAASIVAKVTRDREMIELSKIYPQYGWDKNAGYGTKEHIDAIEKYGITPVHRRSYKPISFYLETHSEKK